MKNIISLIIAIAITTAFPYFYSDYTNKEKVRVLINNSELIFSSETGYPIYDNENNILLPIRTVMEKMGAIVLWDMDKKQIRLQVGENELVATVDKDYYYLNNKKLNNKFPIRNIMGTVYFCPASILPQMDFDVKWSDYDRTLNIDSKIESGIINKIPSTYDLRKTGKVTSVKNQMEIGACWAFAALGAIESVLISQGEYDFSEDHMSLNHGYKVSQNQGGDFHILMSYLARWDGPVLEEEDAYGDGETNPFAKAAVRVQEAKILPSKDYAAIKLSILLYGGVESVLFFDETLLEANNNIYKKETNSYYYKGNAKYNHAIVITGWDDDYPKENFAIAPEGNGAFICKNSYGEEFGDEGYFYVSYYDKYIGTENVVFSRIDDIKRFDNIYQSDYLGWIGKLGYGEDSAYFANAYTPRHEKETLEAVSFYTTGEKNTYEVYLVENFKNSVDFKRKKLITSGNIEYKGYYTIDLEEPVPLEEKYAVVVKLTTPGTTLPVAAEYYKKVPWLDKVVISDGEGYMSFDGYAWDSTEKIYDSNICLKAFTKTVKK